MMKENDLDAVIASLAFAYNNIEKFHEYLIDQGHKHSADYATYDKLNELRIEFTDQQHKLLNREYPFNGN